MARERPESLRVGCRQRIIRAVAAVVEQQGRKWTAARRTPQLRAERQRTASHVEHLWGTLDWLPRAQRDACGNRADDDNGRCVFHDFDSMRGAYGGVNVVARVFAMPSHAVIDQARFKEIRAHAAERDWPDSPSRNRKLWWTRWRTTLASALRESEWAVRGPGTWSGSG